MVTPIAQRRTLIAASTATLVVLASPSSGQDPDKRFTDFADTVVEYYDVPSTRERDIRRSLNELGPVSTTKNERFDALTAYNFRWRTRTKPDGNCDAQIDFTSTVTFPQLENYAGLSRSARRKWDAYILELERHEVGHLEITYSVRPAVEIAFDGVSCETGRQRIKAALAQLRDLHVQYDDLTDHGKRTGATFP
ncbi:MAG: DUF922 domain-containing protein [Pseudomonadota bacterium]